MRDDPGVDVRGAVHLVAGATPGGGDGEQNGLLFPRGTRECVRAPGEPLNAIVGHAGRHRGQQETGIEPSLNYNDRMLLLRFAAVLTLVVWVGGLLALGGVVAPAIFDVTAAHHVSDRRLLSGAVFGEILQRFDLVCYVAGTVLLLTLVDPGDPRAAAAALRLAGGARPGHARDQRSTAALILGVASISCRPRSASRRPASRPTIPGASSSDGCTGCPPSCSWCRSSEG